MPVSNRNQHDPGRLRVHIACPVCGSRCLIRSSDGQSVLSRMSYVRCTNELCGWSGVAVTEIVRTLSPPSQFVDESKAPPPVDGKYLEAVAAEVSATRQGELL
jgi:ogr/delta-like zinc finger